MISLYEMLKSTNYMNPAISCHNFVVSGPLYSKPQKATSIFTAANFLKYCKLWIRYRLPKKTVGLSLASFIADEPRFREGIIRRCEIPLRTNALALGKLQHTKKNQGSKVKILQAELEPKHDTESEVKLVASEELTTGLEPMVVNDIQSFALLDAKFRASEERNRLNESLCDCIEDEEFIREIYPTYSDTAIECCTKTGENPPETDEQKLFNLLREIKEDSSMEVIMSPDPKEADSCSEGTCPEEEAKDKKPVLTKLTLIKSGQAKFTAEKDDFGWRIKESFKIYQARQEKLASEDMSRLSQCVSDESRKRQPHWNNSDVKYAASSRVLPKVRHVSEETQRRKREAEKRIRASYKAFVARQTQARNSRVPD